jgi:3-methyladenine DNA glycosylase AlkD
MTGIAELKAAFIENADADAAVMMKKYMKNQFEFLGLNKPLRSDLQKQFIADNKKQEISNIMSVAANLAALPFREYFYTGIDLLQASIRKMDISHMYEMTELAATVNPWWDSVDTINIAIKKWFALGANNNNLDEFIRFAATHESMWANRISLLCQLHMKERLNTSLLEFAINAFKDSDEFFLKKAIGWILREYSKYNPGYVRDFLSNNRLKPLSVREASKYI